MARITAQRRGQVGPCGDDSFDPGIVANCAGFCAARPAYPLFSPVICGYVRILSRVSRLELLFRGDHLSQAFLRRQHLLDQRLLDPLPRLQ